MENFTPISALLGGGLIGLAAVILMGTLGRVAGISGITGGLISFSSSDDKSWRLAFVLGLILVPIILVFVKPDLSVLEFKLTGWPLLISGAIVGWGTQLGNGCTSGHGVCGNARFSARSIVATVTFMIAGFVTVFISKYFGLYL